jgi:hypothetical protein
MDVRKLFSACEMTQLAQDPRWLPSGLQYRTVWHGATAMAHKTAILVLPSEPQMLLGSGLFLVVTSSAQSTGCMHQPTDYQL